MRFLALVVVALGFAPSSSAIPGELDPTFSGDGWVRTLDVVDGSTYYAPNGAVDVAIQPNGKILTAGEIEDYDQGYFFGVFRHTQDGALDRSFGRGGVAAVRLGWVQGSTAVALQRNGKVVVGGEGECRGGYGCSALARFRVDGSVDRSFGGGDGVVRWRRFSIIHDIAIQRRGRIVAVGRAFSGDADAQNVDVFLVARFRPDGRLDRTFSGNGWRFVDFGYGNQVATSVTLQRGGKILVAGQGSRNIHATGDDFALARLLPSGRLDRGFSRDGRVTASFGSGRTTAPIPFASSRTARSSPSASRAGSGTRSVSEWLSSA